MRAFVGFASYRIHSPGLYYDELLFVPAAMGRHEAFQTPYGSWLGVTEHLKATATSRLTTEPGEE
jgi:hypothetical protein